MAILNYNQAPAKGSTSVVTLSKADLVAVAQLAADSYWSVADNLKAATILLQSIEGREQITLIFDCTQTSPTANLTFPVHCRSSFGIKQILVEDYLKDSFVVNPSLPSENINL
jgi:hypothetical protein